MPSRKHRQTKGVGRSVVFLLSYHHSLSWCSSCKGLLSSLPVLLAPELTECISQQCCMSLQVSREKYSPLSHTYIVSKHVEVSLSTDWRCQDCIKERGKEECCTTQWPHIQQQKCVPQTQDITCHHQFQLLYVTFMWKVKQKQMGLRFGRGFQQGDPRTEVSTAQMAQLNVCMSAPSRYRRRYSWALVSL